MSRNKAGFPIKYFIVFDMIVSELSELVGCWKIISRKERRGAKEKEIEQFGRACQKKLCVLASLRETIFIL